MHKDYRERLENERGRLEREIASVAARGVTIEPDELDQAAEFADIETNAGIRRDLESRLAEVIAALGRIRNGTYGVCAAGGEPIEKTRLDADPAAATCKKHLK